MPKFNTNNPEVQDYLINVAEYWMKDFHVDGYRLDVSEGVSHDFWIRFKLALRKINPEVLVIGENWLNSESFLGNHQFDGVMNYPFLSAVSGYLLRHSNAHDTSLYLQQLLMRYKDGHNRMMLNILASHDIQRLINLVHSKDLCLLGYAIMVFYLGYPMIYYGEEIFMDGGPDPDNRKGMRWDSKDFNDYLHETFKALLHLRSQEPLETGEISFADKNDLLIITRYNDQQIIKLYCNLSKAKVKIKGDAIIHNKFSNNTLSPDGFAVIKEK